MLSKVCRIELYGLTLGGCRVWNGGYITYFMTQIVLANLVALWLVPPC